MHKKNSFQLVILLNMKKKKSLWITLGIALGSAIGLVYGNLAIGISFGFLLGLTIGIYLEKRDLKNK